MKWNSKRVLWKPEPSWLKLGQFDEAYTKHAKVDKDISHSHFSSDLNTIQESFPDDSDFKYHIRFGEIEEQEKLKLCILGYEE